MNHLKTPMGLSISYESAQTHRHQKVNASLGPVTQVGCDYILSTLYCNWAHMLVPCSPLLSEH